MKLSVLPVSLFSKLSSQEMTVAQWAEFAQKLPVDGFDTSILFYPSAVPTALQQIKRELEEKEISTSVIGELVMNNLKDLDEVAYVRFASVYREFKDVNTFMEELGKLLKK